VVDSAFEVILPNRNLSLNGELRIRKFGRSWLLADVSRYSERFCRRLTLCRDIGLFWAFFEYKKFLF